MVRNIIVLCEKLKISEGEINSYILALFVNFFFDGEEEFFFTRNKG